jgi:hypothetical protein
MTLKEFIGRHKAGALDIPKGHELRVIVDMDHVKFQLHPGWDDEGEERGEPTYITVTPEYPNDMLIEALRLLGLPAEGA